jgi:hypothetical protein
MLSSALRMKIIEFIDNKITIAELENWLVPNLQSLISSPESIDADVISAIELGLAEIDAGLRSQHEFVEFLLEVLSEESIKTTYPITSATTSSSSAGDNRYIVSNTLDNQSANITWRQVEAGG